MEAAHSGSDGGTAHGAGDEPQPHAPTKAERAADKRGGPGHSVLLVVILMLPAIKVAWTVGGGTETSDLVTAMGPANWPDVLVGMLMGDALFASLLAVVAARISFAYFAARGAVPHGDSSEDKARLVVLSYATPLAYAVLITVFFGPWWGLGTGLAAFVLRYGIIVEYRTGRRGSHRERRREAPAWERRSAAVGQWTALVLTAVVLPLVALADALDGRSWAPVVTCSVDYGQGPSRARLIEVDRVGNGVVGWDLAAHEVANGLDCAADEDDVVREPWWRG